MKTLLKKIVISLSFIFLIQGQITPLFSQDFGTRILPSLEWQKQELSGKITKKISNSIKPIIKNDDFLIDVEIDASSPVKPEFNKTDEEQELERKAKEVEEGMTPEELAEQQRLEAEEARRNNARNKVRFSDVDPKDLPEDSILFSKLGLEAPLIDDFKDFQPSGKIILTYGDLMKEKGDNMAAASANLASAKTKQARLRAKLEALKNKPKPSAVEQIWKYNESVDIFKNLKSVKIRVQLSDEVGSGARDTIAEVLNNLNFNLGKIKPELKIEYVDMSESFGKGFLSGTLKDLINFISKFSTMFGLIGGALVLGALAWLLFNRYEKLQESERQVAATAMMENQQSEDEDKDSDAGDMGGMMGMDGDLAAQGLNGIERFKTFLSKNELDASLLVKKWIKIGEKEDINALRALVQQLENSDLSKVFAILTPEERNIWKSFLDKTIDADGIRRANLYISNQIVEEIIVPSAITDSETLDLLLKIKPDKAAAFVQENPEEGKILMNVMNTKFVAQIIDHIDKGRVDTIIDASLDYDESLVEQHLDSFKAKLREYQPAENKNPFLDRVRELIPISTPGKENALYKALGKTGEQDSLYDLAMQNFPAVLIPELPSFFLKEVLQKYPMSSKVEMLLSVDEGLRDHFVGIYAPVGSKANDMLELEFQKAEDDLLMQKNIRTNSEQIWKSFVSYTRRMIKSNKSINKDVDAILSEWSAKICNGQSPEQAALNLDYNSNIAA